MWIQICITILIVAFVGYILYKNLKAMFRGDCGCGNCGSKKKRNIK